MSLFVYAETKPLEEPGSKTGIFERLRRSGQARAKSHHPIAEVVSMAAPSFTGRLLRPTDPAYDDRRRVHDGLIDKHPALIASCQGIADIVAAIALAPSLGVNCRYAAAVTTPHDFALWVDRKTAYVPLLR